MTKYRKRPVEVEAQQWDGTPEGAGPIIDWILSCGGTARYRKPGPLFRATLHIDTLEGIMNATAGDFIIRGVAGEFYPCREDIFAKTYEVAEDAA